MARERIDIIVRERGAAKTARSVRNIGAAARFGAAGVAALGAALAGLGLALTAGGIVRFADAFTTLNNQIRLVTNSQEELVKVQRQVFRVAQETRTPVEITTTLFRRLSLATKELGLEQGDVLDVTKAVNQATIVSGATSEEARNGIIQLSQGLGSARLSGDELRSVLEQLPRIAEAIAEEMGVARGALRDLGKQGAITPKIVVSALLNTSSKLDKEFLKINATTEQAFTVLRNAVLQSVGTIDTALESTKLFAGGVIDLAFEIDVLIVDGFARLLDAIADGIEGFANFVEVLESFGVDLTLITNIFGVLGANGVLALRGLVNGLNVLRLGALSVASALELVGNAFGLVSDEEVLRGLTKLEKANLDLAESSKKTEEAFIAAAAAEVKLVSEFFTEEETNEASNNLNGLAAGIRGLAGEVRTLGKEALEAKNAVDDLARAGGVVDKPLPAFVPADDVISSLDPKNAAQRSQDLFGRTDEEIADAIRDGIQDPKVDDAIERLSGQLASGVSGAVGSALRGEAIDFAGFFQDLLTSELEAGLKEAFQNSLELLEQGLSKVFDTASFGGESGIDLGALGATLGVIGTVAAAGFAGTSESISRGGTRSAVDAIAPTRGAIVGPSNIPIFQVADSISDSIAPLISEAVDQGTTLKQILAAIRSSGGADLSAALDQFLSQEFNTSPSLG